MRYFSLFIFQSLVIPFLFGFSPVKAQSFVSAENSIDNCGKQVSVYQELMKMNYWSDAYHNWQKTMKNCSSYEKIMLNDGDKIISTLLKSSNKSKNKHLIDSLFYIYDKKSKLFDKKNYYETKKAFTSYKYTVHSAQNLLFIYQNLENIQKKDSLNFPKQALFLKLITSNLLQQKLSISKKQFIAELLNDYEYSLKHKDNAIRKKIVVYYLKKGNITPESLVYHLPTNYSIPNFSSFILLTVKMQWKIDSLKGKKLLNTILNTKVWNDKIDAYTIANLYLYSARQNYKSGFLQRAKKKAIKASGFQSTAAYAYLLLGDIYSKTAQINNPEFYSAALYCLAVDKYKLAYKLKPKLSDSLKIKIKKIQNYFPSAEEAFFYGIKSQTNYHIGSWIQDDTKIRFRN